MKLCVPMVIELRRSLKSVPWAESVVLNFFKSHKGEFGYHTYQLMVKHGLPAKYACVASAFLNVWLRTLQTIPVDERVRKRMQLCAFSYSYLSNRVTACNHRLCPLCRAVKVLHITGLLSRLPPTKAGFLVVLVDKHIPKFNRVPGALLTLRNMIRSGDVLAMKQILLFADPGSKEDHKKNMLDLLGYDFSILKMPKPMLDLWLEGTDRLKLFSRAQR